MTGTGTSRGAVVLTGASTGIGATAAHHLAGLGFDVHAGVRREEDGERLVAADSTGRVRPLTIDVCDQDTIDAARERLEPAGVVGLVNNAGIAVPGPIELLPLDEWRRQLEVNVVGQVAVTQAFLPALRASQGRIVFTGSMAGRIGLPGMAPYAASKHALEALADSLRREVRDFGIRVSLLEPGSISTPIWSKGLDELPRMREMFGPRGQELYGSLIDAIAEEASRQDEIGIAPEVVADAIGHALTARRPKHRYVIGKDAQAVVRVVRHLPSGLVDRIVARQLG
jgi:NAD(P)-dependent dehydrogenase (short-subunit alcohol dehydrogenase family)